MIISRHELQFCNHCQSLMVVCITCKNNCCNGGYGKVNGETCPDCKEAYQHQDIFQNNSLDIQFTNYRI